MQRIIATSEIFPGATHGSAPVLCMVTSHARLDIPDITDLLRAFEGADFQLYLWRFALRPNNPSRIESHKRAFLSARTIHAASVISLELCHDGKDVWFGIAHFCPTATLAEDLLLSIRAHDFSHASGLVISRPRQIDCLARRIVATMTDIWSLHPFDGHDWPQSAWSTYLSAVPDTLLVASDIYGDNLLISNSDIATEILSTLPLASGRRPPRTTELIIDAPERLA